MKLHCDIQLPTSKSESNRALMIASYGGFPADFQNLSDSHDTLVLSKALGDIKNGNAIIDVADCGTAARFLVTYLASHDGDWILTGTERMKQRPIRPLVEALMGLNADIQYVEKQGFLPLHIHGKPLQGGKTNIDMTLSSQFVSSLLLAAPMFSQGLELELLGELNSLPYLDMTLTIMRHFGADAKRLGRMVVVKPKSYQPRSFVVSVDWSAASYWYEMAALSEECEIKLNGLRGPSTLRGSSWAAGSGTATLQGDAIITEWMKVLGVNTLVDEGSLVLNKIPFEKHPLSFDFSNTPDLFSTMAATCAGLQLEARFKGIANLRIKESDRVVAMSTELNKLGVLLEDVSENEVVLRPSTKLLFFEKSNPLALFAHNDHRIVMALAPLAMRVGSVVFDHPEVVGKSYPAYWEDADFLAIQG